MVDELKGFIQSNKHALGYKKLVYALTEKYSSLFREANRVFDKTDMELIKYTPFMFSSDNNVGRRKDLINFVSEEKDLFCGDDRLTSIGNGSIDENGFMIVGMTAGFRYANEYDEISFPFKWSFFFGEASEILRRGFLSVLDSVYFTNVGKYAYSRDIMNSKNKYTEVYEDCFRLLETEIALLKPRKILAMGTDVYSFLVKKGIKSTKLIHPASFLFKHTKNAGIEYYRNFCRENL